MKKDRQNIYCKSTTYKGPVQNNPPEFWDETLFTPIFATPKRPVKPATGAARDSSL